MNLIKRGVLYGNRNKYYTLRVQLYSTLYYSEFYLTVTANSPAAC